MNDGVEIIKTYVKNLPGKPGVYRMMDDAGNVLYVGKAKSLKNRVANYTNLSGLSYRIARMVHLTRSMEFITTHTEVEALLLEANMIKRLKPPYNILLRDDKSFPYIMIDTSHPAPQVKKHRGAKTKEGLYYGPFASAQAVNHSLHILQRAFLLRTCSDSVYKSRTRPCMLYQIKRCAGPCVDKISLPEYGNLVHSADDFLSGRSQAIKDDLTHKMEQASAEQSYELAALLRDRLKALAAVQSRQDGNQGHVDEADIIAGVQQGGQTCIQVFFFRAGQNWGNKAYFPRHHKDQSISDVLPAFISQFYDNKPPPRLILINSHISQRSLLEEALSLKAERKVKISFPQRGDKLSLLHMVEKNAKEALQRRLAETSSQKKLLAGVAELFDLDGIPNRIEIYDNSHISGTNALGAMVVAGPEGFDKNSYRKFNIKSTDLTPGDDFAMMREVMTRRFKRQLKEDPDRNSPTWPDLLLIDGGKGQLSAVQEIMAELGLEGIPLVAIAKGPDRNAGREDFYLPGKAPFKLPPTDPTLYFLQRLRDESHRFVIGSHRQQRGKNMQKSILDGLPGIGPSRKKALLLHFGSAKAVEGAALEDLQKVTGISRSLAQTIYNYFHEDA
ncbi:excinuclease ABC subunit UvrC [Paremcibacter congregatus]|uniref:UvrABC system protein C n=1 Tax=Paremcibacter congregatus TaxID=2043170 RepID=A0A2G4YN57_9PROT|nr:excinuclease ABC subunit UvrC [Paremcibacter congregatus]PHZ83769.1 excinuclease ABC subunit C [Paremcibacter congregatus]QDE27471.1 excinuclease ABC subunit UvrC [Paremcibacter congregatus]